MSHLCQRCGASCQGLRVRWTEAERAELEQHAEALGVQRPLSGVWLRQNWGVCVFYDRGCRLHARFGVEAKPAACRAFPEGSRIDPAYFHPGEQGSARLLPGWNDLSIGEGVRARLRCLPFASVCKPALLGPLTAEALSGLDDARPQSPGEWIPRLDWRARNAVCDLERHAQVEQLLIGGGQLLAGLNRSGLFAAWVRLLRVLPSL